MKVLPDDQVRDPRIICRVGRRLRNLSQTRGSPFATWISPEIEFGFALDLVAGQLLECGALGSPNRAMTTKTFQLRASSLLSLPSRRDSTFNPFTRPSTGTSTRKLHRSSCGRRL